MRAVGGGGECIKGQKNLAIESVTFIHETTVLVPTPCPSVIVILPGLTSH